jgi:hypothetical protein
LDYAVAEIVYFNEPLMVVFIMWVLWQTLPYLFMLHFNKHGVCMSNPVSFITYCHNPG